MSPTTLNRQNFDATDILSEPFRQNWFDEISTWTTRDPFFVDVAGRTSVIVCRQEHLRAVLGDQHRFTTAVPRNAGYDAFDMYLGLPDLLHLQGEDHRRVRQLFQSAMSPRFVQGYVETIQAIVEGLIDRVEGRREFDAVADFTAYLIVEILFGNILSLEKGTSDLFRRMKVEITTVHTAGGHTESYLAMFRAALTEIERVIDERVEAPTADFIGAMIKASAEQDQVSREEIIGNVFATGAGSVLPTSASATALLWDRCRYRDEFDRLRARPELIASAVEESLRHHPGGIFILPRFALEATEIGGTEIPPGMAVLPCVAAANFDPDVYPEPFRFDIARNPRGIFTFGRGMHNCAGALLARKILETTLSSVMRRLPDLDLIDRDFRPTYWGQAGELATRSMPVRPR